MKFQDEFLDRLEKAYGDEVFNIFNEMPQPVVRFNNTESLKRAQMYVRHTNRIFSKLFARLISSLLCAMGHNASTAKDSRGDCVYDKNTKTRFHFMSLEQIAGFPHVPWFNPTKGFTEPSNSVKDVYVIMVGNDDIGNKVVNQMKSVPSPKPHSFVSFEEFIVNTFGETCYCDLMQSFHEIEDRSASFQWFELAKTCNEVTLDEFKERTGDFLYNTRFEDLFPSHYSQLDAKTRAILDSTFSKNGRYKLLLGELDFAKSFCTSEWLFGINQRDDLLDKTYIIAGYIKSVEQLLSFIIQSQAGDYKITVLDKGQYKEVSTNSEESLSATLGNMVRFLKAFENRTVFHEGISSFTIKRLSAIIQDWIKYERNGYFHKHNISSMARVEEIRNSTLLIYYLLLGSIKTI